MCTSTNCPTTTSSVSPYNVYYKGYIYEGMNMKKPSLGNDASYQELYLTTLLALPKKEVVGLPLTMNGYVYRTVIEGVDYVVSGNSAAAKINL